MNLEFLGDALDHWKGSIFAHLQHHHLLRAFHVDPMASDLEQWKEQDFVLFATLLRVRPAQVIRHATAINRDRPTYFRDIPTKGDLFLDPDTGIATGRVKNLAQYVAPSELRALLEADVSRVVAVYQHIRAKETRQRLEEIMEALKLTLGRFLCVSYESPTVAMLFFSNSLPRVVGIKASFCRLLGRHGSGRISFWCHGAGEA